MPCIPVMAERRRRTATPITIWCRCRRTACVPARSTPIPTATFSSCQAPAADRRWCRPVPGGRWAAGRDGRTQAVLARQLFVRSGSCAGQPGLQALSADRARKEREIAAAEQRRNRQQCRLWRLLAPTVDTSSRRLLRSHGRRHVAGAARSPARAKEAITALEEQVKAR